MIAFLKKRKLRHTSQTTKFTLLKNIAQWFFVYSQGCATVTSIQSQNIFITSERHPVPLAVSPPPPSSWQPLTCFLSLGGCFFSAYIVTFDSTGTL